MTPAEAFDRIEKHLKEIRDDQQREKLLGALEVLWQDTRTYAGESERIRSQLCDEGNGR